MKPSVTAAAGCDIPGLLVRGIQGNRTNKRHFISISIYLSISISICLFIYMLAVGLVTNSCLTLVTPQTVARQAPLPMGFSRQGYWSGLRDNIHLEEKEGRKEGREGEEGKEENKEEGKREEKMESHTKVY